MEICNQLLNISEFTSNLKVSFLCFDITVKHWESETRLYDAFHFSIVRMPYWKINMLIRIFGAVVESEIIHMARIICSWERFLELIATLLTKKHKQGCQNVIKTPLH